MNEKLPKTTFAKAEHTAAATIVTILSHFAVNVLEKDAYRSNNGNNQSSECYCTKMIPDK